MKFYFCGRYINTDVEDKKVERDMYATILYFQGSNDPCGYEEWKNYIEDFFSYFSLIPEQKCHYVQMKLAEKVYWWWKGNQGDCRHWFVL